LAVLNSGGNGVGGFEIGVYDSYPTSFLPGRCVKTVGTTMLNGAFESRKSSFQNWFRSTTAREIHHFPDKVKCQLII